MSTTQLIGTATKLLAVETQRRVDPQGRASQTGSPQDDDRLNIELALRFELRIDGDKTVSCSGNLEFSIRSA